MSLFRKPPDGTVSTIGIVIMVTLASAILYVGDDLPDRIVVPWGQGECYWLNGTVVDREKMDNRLTTTYQWHVVGTLDNNTSFDSLIYGNSFEWVMIPVGAHYEGHVCDTMPLRDAVLNGTVEIIDWVVPG